MIEAPQQMVVPWKSIAHDHPRPKAWIDSWQCERFVKAYLVKHPEKIADGATLAGIEVEIPSECFEAGFDPSSFVGPVKDNNPKADLVFIRGDDYYVVEVKESIDQIGKAMREASSYASALSNLLTARGIRPRRIVPVGSALDQPTRLLPKACRRIDVGPEQARRHPSPVQA